MTAIRLTRGRAPRWWRRSGRALAFATSAGLAIAGVAGAGSADAGSPPTYTYSSSATAIGVQIALQQNPEISSLPDPFDARTPESDTELDSFGTSQADGHIGNLNGLGGIPGLICLLAGASTCNAIPVGQLTGGLIPNFPPPDPLDAHATYPATQTAKAPLIGTKVAQASFDSSGFSLGAGTANAQAHQYDTAAQAVDQNLGIAGVLSIGNATASTSQVADADKLTTTAVVKLSDIGLGGTLLHIGAMRSTTTVVSRPGKPATDKTSTELADVTVAGVPATIDSTGIHIDKNGLPANAVAAAQKLVNQLLGKAGIRLALGQTKSSNDTTGHTVAAAGLLLTFDHTVSGVRPIVIAPPQGVPCPLHLPPPFPIDPCAGISLSLDAAYHGQVTLGQVGVVSLAQPSAGPQSVPPPAGTTTPASGATTTPGGGEVGPGVTPPTGPDTTSSGPPPTPPVIAAQQRQVADQLHGVSDRLEWFFPLFAVCLLAIIGRLRTPSRLPGTGPTSD